ncbi:hypothetical protein Ac2012v2_003427 [Leucoagaricus gongylophorus]
MLFYASLLGFILVLALVLYRYREILPHVPERVRSFFPRLHHYTPLSTFSQQANAGLTSSAFDIEANLRDGDSRAGLDEQGTQEVLKIMSREHVNFDQARLIRHNRILARNGIDPSGMPLDLKAVTQL